jgi:uncharacterized protein YlxW (UPF0749 family)
MRKKKNPIAKIMAAIALIAILLGIVWTGILVIANSLWGDTESVSQEELEQYIESLSGSLSASGAESIQP